MIGIAILAVVGIITYLFSVRSRKEYHCPSCGEKITTEHLDALRCSVCGAELNKQ